MLITSEHIGGACQNQIDLFNKTFPVSAEFNKTNWCLALSVGLQVGWMEKFLDKSACKIYKKAAASAWKIYKAEEASAFKIYYDATVPARKIYDEAIASAFKIYEEATAPARKIYDEARSSAWKIWCEKINLALFNALEQQFNRVK